MKQFFNKIPPPSVAQAYLRQPYKHVYTKVFLTSLKTFLFFSLAVKKWFMIMASNIRQTITGNLGVSCKLMKQRKFIISIALAVGWRVVDCIRDLLSLLNHTIYKQKKVEIIRDLVKTCTELRYYLLVTSGCVFSTFFKNKAEA